VPRQGGRLSAARKRRAGPGEHAAPPRRQPADAAVEWLRIAGLTVIALKFALVPVVFDPLGDDVFGVAKSLASRTGMYLLLCLGGAFFVLSGEARQRLFRPRIIVAGLLTFGFISTLATVLAIDPRTALFGAHHRYLGLTSILDGVLLAFAIPLFVARAAELRWIYGGLFGGALVVVGYAALQSLRLDPLAWTGDPFTSTLGNRGVYAGYLVVIATALGHTAMTSPRPRWVVMLGAASALAAGLAVSSGVRGAILALPTAYLFSIGVAVRGGWRPSPRFGRIVVAIGALAGVVGLSWAFSAAAPRLATLLTGGDTSLAERTLVYEAALGMISARPLLGAGPDHFGVLYPLMRPLAAADFTSAVAAAQTSAHSWPLHHAVGTGLLGVAALAILIAASIRGSLRRGVWGQDDAPRLGAVTLIAFLLQSLFEPPNVGTDFLFWGGIGLTAVGPFVPASGTAARQTWRSQSIAVGLFAAAVGMAGAFSVGSALEANRAVRTSDALRSAGKLDLAEQAALVATERDPGRANNWNVLGLARSPTSPARALSAFERAWAAAPYDSRYLINVVKEEARLGEADKRYFARALEHALRAVEIDPRNPETHVVLSFALLKTGDALGARREADRAISLGPKTAEYYRWSAAIYEDTGEFTTAVSRYESYAKMITTGTMDGGTRLRLAQLYVRAGLLDRARSLGGPRFLSAIKGCPDRCSHVLLRFESGLGLATDGPGDVRDPRRYQVDGRSLPTAVSIHVLDGPAVLITAPEGTDLVRSGSTIRISGLTDPAGIPLEPDPTTVVVP
jgi:O-antigen ligase/Flp pilus assembly protein TadD